MEEKPPCVCGGGSGKEERFVQVFPTDVKAIKKESSKKFHFRIIVLKMENCSCFHSMGDHKEGALSISHFRQFPFLELHEQLLASLKDRGFGGPDY